MPRESDSFRTSVAKRKREKQPEDSWQQASGTNILPNLGHDLGGSSQRAAATRVLNMGGNMSLRQEAFDSVHLMINTIKPVHVMFIRNRYPKLKTDRITEGRICYNSKHKAIYTYPGNP